VGTVAPAALAQPAPVLPPTAHPYGQTYGEWAADWWVWALQQPAATNPLIDETGANCAVAQQGPVWFLAGSPSGKPITRSCTVPTGKALLFPVLNAFACPEPPDPQTEDVARTQASQQLGDVTSLTATIDGATVSDVGAYLEESALFQLKLPEGNIFGIPATDFPICADKGYYLVVTPLPPGEHTIHFTGSTASGFVVDVTYNIAIAPGR
jgi:hypothetical protein